MQTPNGPLDKSGSKIIDKCTVLMHKIFQLTKKVDSSYFMFAEETNHLATTPMLMSSFYLGFGTF